MQTAIPMAPQKTSQPPAEGALFDFDDLQALRDEYEERIARLEREKVAAVDVLKKDYESRLATQQRDYESRLQNEAASRQDLIHELTFELAAAREDGERRAQEADKRRIVVEQQLHGALAEISRIEGDVQRLKDNLMRALDVKAAPTAATAAPVATTSSTPDTPSAPSAAASEPPPIPADDAVASTTPAGLSPSVAAFAPKKKKIRLR